MQTMFRYIPCRLIPYPARCAGNQVHPNIFNTTKHNGPGGTGRESGGASDLFTDSGLSSVGPRGNIHLGTVSIPGWSSVPLRLLRKISSLEFVDMWELLPESWRLVQSNSSCCHARRPRCGLVTNFLLWTECFATFVAVLATREPEETPHFMAYLCTIT